MWRRLHEANVTGKMFRMIKSLYVDCSSAVLTDAGLTDWFKVDQGTRQGAVLSPFLFSIMISPLVDELHRLGKGTWLGVSRIGCLLFADDIVLIADSELKLQSMMNVATIFFRQWRFKVSEGKTRVVSLGHGETKKLRSRFWYIGGCIVKAFASYTYLGIEFDKTGNWLNMLKRGTEKCRSSMGHLHTLIDEDSLSLPVGQLAELWGLFARSRLLYGSEIWSAPSATALEKLEVVQAMAGRQILGKSGGSNVIREAVLGDLGWMSIKSHLRLAKLRLFGRLEMLPISSLAKTYTCLPRFVLMMMFCLCRMILDRPHGALMFSMLFRT
jgi:hypothetical protein